MLKVISFSLWGNEPKYTQGAIQNAKLAQEIYPGWDCHFFIGSDTSPHIKNELAELPNTVLHLKNEPGNWSSMSWRFETSYDPNINISIFRDTDSRLNFREKAAVDEWLRSDKTFHIMRDHPYHGFVILGGMWGYKKNIRYNMKEMFSNFNAVNEYGNDYDFFLKTLYPTIGQDKIMHDEFFDGKPFPRKRENWEFVGDVFDENNIRHPEHYLKLKEYCLRPEEYLSKIKNN